MKKIAVCISGQMRNIQRESPIFEFLNSIECDIFVSTWENQGSTTAYDRFFPSSYIANLLLEKNNGNKFIYDKDNFILSYPSLFSLFYEQSNVSKAYLESIFENLKSFHIEKFPSTFDKDNTLHNTTYPKELYKYMPERYKYSLPMYYMIYKVDKLRKEYEIKKNM